MLPNHYKKCMLCDVFDQGGLFHLKNPAQKKIISFIFYGFYSFQAKVLAIQCASRCQSTNNYTHFNALLEAFEEDKELLIKYKEPKEVAEVKKAANTEAPKEVGETTNAIESPEDNPSEKTNSTEE